METLTYQLPNVFWCHSLPCRSKTLWTLRSHSLCFAPLESQWWLALSTLLFFHLFSHLSMQRTHQLLDCSSFSPLLIVPVNRGIRRQVWRVSLPSCSHSSVDRRCHWWCLFSSSLRVSSAFLAVISQPGVVQELPILSRLSCWSLASLLF